MKVYFLGIAGAGVSALASVLVSQGAEVTGSDEGVYPPVSTYLDRLGVTYHDGFDPALVPSDMLLVLPVADVLPGACVVTGVAILVLALALTVFRLGLRWVWIVTIAILLLFCLFLFFFQHRNDVRSQVSSAGRRS